MSEEGERDELEQRIEDTLRAIGGTSRLGRVANRGDSMTGWIVGYALAGLVVAVLALREFAPFDSHGDRASTGGMGLLMGAAWPLVLTGWLLARIAEGNRRERWTPPMPSALHSPSGRPPSVPPRDGCDHGWVEVTVHGDSHEQWMCSKCAGHLTGEARR